MSKDCGKIDEAGNAAPHSNYPNKLDKIIHLFETLPEDERRKTAAQAKPAAAPAAAENKS